MKRALLSFAFLFSFVSIIFAAEDSVPTAPAIPAQTPSKGEYYVGHRFYEENGGGWGWIKKPSEPWGIAKWCALKERPKEGAVAPFRKLEKRYTDQNHEYKLYGHFENYQAYDPHKDELLPVFSINGYEDMGEAVPLARPPGSNERLMRHQRSRAYSRDPILSRDEDYF